MDRFPISSAVPADVAERLSDRADDITRADEARAIRSILDDYLLLGDCYPPRGGKIV